MSSIPEDQTSQETSEGLPPGTYASVELFGHQQLIGRIQEVKRFGVDLMQLEAVLAGKLMPPVLIGGAAIALLFYTRGSVDALVVMYSINVFITFSLSQLGMSKFFIDRRKEDPARVCGRSKMTLCRKARASPSAQGAPPSTVTARTTRPPAPKSQPSEKNCIRRRSGPGA